MDFKLINDDKISISLSINDMQRLDITFDEFDYADINTRRVIWTLLCEAKDELCPELDLFSKMLIEVFPSKEGGCNICFTVLGDNRDIQSSKLTVKKSVKPFVFEFKDVDSLILAFEQSDRFSELSFEGCELIFSDNRYYLILEGIGKSLCGLPNYLQEFGSYIGQGRDIASYAREHGKCLADSEGLRRMAKALYRRVQA